MLLKREHVEFTKPEAEIKNFPGLIKNSQISPSLLRSSQPLFGSSRNEEEALRDDPNKETRRLALEKTAKW